MASSTTSRPTCTFTLDSRPSATELLPFHNEIDILKARVELMAGHIGRHVIAEGDLTHQGDPKPRYLDGVSLPAHVERNLAVLPTGEGDQANWARERAQRDILASFVADLDPDALVISADVDEIIDPAAIQRIYEACEHGPVALDMRMIYYGTREDPNGWAGAKAFRARHMPASLSDLRLSRCPIVRNTGWHLSYLGDPDRRHQKVRAYAHAENRHPSALARITTGIDGPNGEDLIDADLTTLPMVLQDLIRDSS